MFKKHPESDPSSSPPLQLLSAKLPLSLPQIFQEHPNWSPYFHPCSLSSSLFSKEQPECILKRKLDYIILFSKWLPKFRVKAKFTQLFIRPYNLGPSPTPTSTPPTPPPRYCSDLTNHHSLLSHHSVSSVNEPDMPPPQNLSACYILSAWYTFPSDSFLVTPSPPSGVCSSVSFLVRLSLTSRFKIAILLIITALPVTYSSSIFLSILFLFMFLLSFFLLECK